MKKNKMLRIASVLLVAVMLTTCTISGTFAKYVSSAEATDSARVAKWDVKVEEQPISNTFTFDLFKTIKDSDGTSTEGDVTNLTSDGKKVIAPGTSGSFEVNLATQSEVTSTYTFDYTVVNEAGIPIEFKVGDGEWSSTLTDVTNTLSAGAHDVAANIQWRWAFDGDVDVDTALGKGGTAEVFVNLTITVVQVD